MRCDTRFEERTYNDDWPAAPHRTNTMLLAFVSTIDAVAARANTSKPTIYRRWPRKADLVVAAVADAKPFPLLPDTDSLREDLLECAHAYAAGDDRSHRLLSGLLNELARHETIRDAALDNRRVARHAAQPRRRFRPPAKRRQAMADAAHRPEQRP
jgi:AcrR family transcriptional regulator